MRFHYTFVAVENLESRFEHRSRGNFGKLETRCAILSLLALVMGSDNDWTEGKADIRPVSLVRSTIGGLEMFSN